jgi:hypothetical protein
MTDHQKIFFKAKLKDFALDLIGQRMTAARHAMQQAQESANSEEKSSAGDKYETGRAMGHLQKDMHARQLAASANELAALHAVNTESIYPEGRIGAYLQTEDLGFFISAGLGKQTIDGQTILFLSPQAPLAKLLQGKKNGDTIVFDKRQLTVKAVF